MGTYNIGADELIDDFEEFLQNQEGDVFAITIAECWNKLAKKHKWDDYLKAISMNPEKARSKK